LQGPDACALGLEGIVSKRRAGRSPTWLKVKDPAYEWSGGM
jgi:ATP-dependent DNA ligase